MEQSYKFLSLILQGEGGGGNIVCLLFEVSQKKVGGSMHRPATGSLFWDRKDKAITYYPRSSRTAK